MKLGSPWNKQNKKFRTGLLGVPGPTMGKNETQATFEELTPGRCSYIYKWEKKKTSHLKWKKKTSHLKPQEKNEK